MENRPSAVPLSKQAGLDLLDTLAASDIPAVATDCSGQLVFWNGAAEALFGLSAARALHKRCHEVLAGRDVFGNRFCYEGCPVLSMSRRQEPVHAFELIVRTARTRQDRGLTVTILRLPGTSPDRFVLVHLLQPNGRRGRQVQDLGGLVAKVRSGSFNQKGQADLAAPASASAQRPLTLREVEILGWISAGLQNKEVAQKLGLSPATIRNHVHNVLEKLEVHSKLEAVSLAFRRGWVGVDSGEATPSSPFAYLVDHELRFAPPAPTNGSHPARPRPQPARAIARR